MAQPIDWHGRQNAMLLSRILLTAALLCLGAPAIVSGQTAPPDSSPLSTAPVDAGCAPVVSPYWQLQLDRHCCGFFAPPLLDELEGAQIRARAPHSILRADGETRLSGGADIELGQLRLHATEVVLDAQGQRATLSGAVRVKSPQAAFTATEAVLDQRSRQVDLRQLHYVLFEQQAHGRAERAQWLGEQLSLDKASFSLCPPGRSGWHFEVERLHVDRERGYVAMRDARLYLGRWPVLRLPAWWLPIGRRRSGLLPPEIGYSSDGGALWYQPLYLNLAPNYDATLALAAMTRRGVLLGAELRRLDTWGTWQAEASFLPDDRVLGTRRWYYRIDHQGGIGAWQSEIDVARVSDRRYFSDLSYLSSGVDEYRHALPQRLQLQHNGRAHHFAVGWERYQSLDPGLVEGGYWREPWLVASTQLGTPGDGPALALALDYAHFSHAERTLGDGGRLHTSLELDWTQRWGALNWRPWLRFEQLWHEGYGSLAAPSAGLDLEWSAMRQLAAEGAIRRLRYRLRYQYTDHRRQASRPIYDSQALRFDRHQLLRNTRFSGHDRIADANRLSLEASAEWRWPAQDAELRLSLGQIYHFADRQVALVEGLGADVAVRSPLAIGIGARVAPWSLGLDLAWDERAGRLDLADLDLAWRSVGGGAELAAQWYFARGEETSGQQVGLRAQLPLGTRWQGHGTWRGNLDDGELIDLELGLDYRSCCWGVGVGFRRSLREESHHEGELLLNFHFGGSPPPSAERSVVSRHE